MTLLALTPSRDKAATRFVGGMAADLPRRAELLQEIIPSQVGLGNYKYDGASSRRSGESLREVIGELLIVQSKRHRIDLQSINRLARYIVMELDTPFVDISKLKESIGLAGAQNEFAARDSAPEWVEHVNSVRSRDVGDVARTISLLLRLVEAENFSEIDAGISHVDFAHADHYHLVAMLRALAEEHRSLKKWPQAKKAVNDRLRSDRLDVASLMQGLDGE